MNKSVIRFINSSKARVVIFDIDGTLKDLCAEHTNALRATLERFEVKGISKKIVLMLNKLAMYIVKTGSISTNHSKQKFVLKVFAMFCRINARDFYDCYFERYTRELCLFDDVDELLYGLNGKQEVYFATINKQNYNLEACGIAQERISYTDGKVKVETYDRIIKSLGVDMSEVVIVGDNIFDDLFSAKKLGAKCFLVNRYKNRLKGLICRHINNRYLK